MRDYNLLMRHGKWELNGGSQFFGTMASQQSTGELSVIKTTQEDEQCVWWWWLRLVVDSLVLFPVGPEYNLIMDDPLRELRRPTN